MPKYGPHLPGIEKEVRDKIAELGLTPKYVFEAKRHQERFYTAPCKEKKGTKVIFKMRTEDFWETKEYFRREIKINQLFTRCYEKSGKLSVPKFIEGDAERVPEWMVYEFIEGFESGDFYNGLEKNNIKRFPLSSLVSAVKNMHKMSAFAEGQIELKKDKFQDFEKAYEKNSPRLQPFFTAEEIRKGGDIIKAHKKLLDEKSTAITHGDFHPGNIVITDKQKIAIIDWYCVHLNNIAFDIAFLYLEITDKQFQKKVLEKFVEKIADDKNEFCQLFRLDVLRLVPHKVNILCDALYTMEPKKSDYYTKLTPNGIVKLETNLEAFQKALLGTNFL